MQLEYKDALETVREMIKEKETEAKNSLVPIPSTDGAMSLEYLALKAFVGRERYVQMMALNDLETRLMARMAGKTEATQCAP